MTYQPNSPPGVYDHVQRECPTCGLVAFYRPYKSTDPLRCTQCGSHERYLDGDDEPARPANGHAHPARLVPRVAPQTPTPASPPETQPEPRRAESAAAPFGGEACEHAYPLDSETCRKCGEEPPRYAESRRERELRAENEQLRREIKSLQYPDKRCDFDHVDELARVAKAFAERERAVEEQYALDMRRTAAEYREIGANDIRELRQMGDDALRARLRALCVAVDIADAREVWHVNRNVVAIEAPAWERVDAAYAAARDLLGDGKEAEKP
jgi:hypothetical protein